MQQDNRMTVWWPCIEAPPFPPIQLVHDSFVRHEKANSITACTCPRRRELGCRFTLAESEWGRVRQGLRTPFTLSGASPVVDRPGGSNHFIGCSCKQMSSFSSEDKEHSMMHNQIWNSRIHLCVQDHASLGFNDQQTSQCYVCAHAIISQSMPSINASQCSMLHQCSQSSINASLM